MSLISKSEKSLLKIPPERVTAGLSRSKYIAQLSQLLKGKARKALIFGSFARNNYSGTSDIDLIVIAETKQNFVDRFKDFPELFSLTPSLDLLVYTQAEFDHLTKPPCSPFWKSVLAEAIEIPLNSKLNK